MPKPGKQGSACPGALTTAAAASIISSNSEITPGSEQRRGLHLATSVCMYTCIYSIQFTVLEIDIYVERL